MKVVLVSVLVMLAAASALAYGNLAVTTSVTAAAAEVVTRSREPAVLLLSGTVLLGLAGAVKRFTI